MQSIKEQRASALKTARDIIDSAKAGNRDLTVDEQKSVQAKFDEIDALDEKIEAAKEGDDLIARMDSMGVDGETHYRSGGPAKAALGGNGEHVAHALKSGTPARFSLKRGDLPGMKAQPTDSSILAGVQSNTVDAALPVVNPRVLAQLFGSAKQVGGGSVRYYQMKGGTADLVDEGEAKPDAGLELTPKDAELQKIAVSTKVTAELQDDAGFIVQAISNELGRSVFERENKLIVDTLAAEAGETAEGDQADVIDVVGSAVADALNANGLVPAALLMSPDDAAALRALKTSGSGEYVINPLTADQAQLHGVTLLPNRQVASGTAFLVTEGFGRFYARHNGIQASVGFAGDDFIENKATMLAEERVVPVVTRPDLVTKITLTSA